METFPPPQDYNDGVFIPEQWQSNETTVSIDTMKSAIDELRVELLDDVSTENLNSIKELSLALNGDSDFGTNVLASIALKAPKLNPSLTTPTLANSTFSGTVSGLTKDNVGLSNVTNTSDSDKEISNLQATQNALFAPLANPNFTGTVNGITKNHIGLSSVDDVSDINKPISNLQATQNALFAKLQGDTNTYSNPQIFGQDCSFQDATVFDASVTCNSSVSINNLSIESSISLPSSSISDSSLTSNIPKKTEENVFIATQTVGDIIISGVLYIDDDSIELEKINADIAITTGGNQTWTNRNIFNAETIHNDKSFFESSSTFNGAVNFIPNSINNNALQSNVALTSGDTTVWENLNIFNQNVTINDIFTVTTASTLNTVSMTDLVATGSITIPNQSISDSALTNNIPKKDVNNSFTGTQLFDNITVGGNIYLEDDSIAISKIDADLVLTTDANQFSKKQFFIKEASETEAIGATEIYAGHLKCEGKDHDNTGNIITHLDTQYEAASGLYGCRMQNLKVNATIETEYLGVNILLSCNKLECSELEFGSKLRVKSLENGRSYMEGLEGGISFGDNDDNVVDSANLTKLNSIGTETLTFQTSINNVTAQTFGYLDPTSSIQTQLNTKSSIIAPTFSGIARVPTASNATNTTQIASTAYVKNVVADLINGAGSTLDTLNELASALGNDADFSTTMTNLIGTKVAQNSYDTKQGNQDTSIATNATDIATNATNIAANVTQSSYDSKQSAQDTTIAEKVLQSAYNTKQSAQDTAIDARLLLVGGVLTGDFVSNQTKSMFEKISTSNVSGTTVNINFSNGAVHYITPANGNNFEALVYASNPASSTHTTCIFTMIIDCSSYTSFANTCKINNTTRSIIFSNGLSNVVVTGASIIQQSVAIVYTDSNSVPACVLSNVVPYF